MSENRILNNIDANVICFDFFDTLVHRNCHPETTLILWARNVIARLRLDIDTIKLYNLRKSAEIKLKSKFGYEEPSYTYLLESVIELLREDCYLDIDTKEFITLSYEIEEDIENKAISIDETILNKIKSYKKIGKKIVIISDYYLPREFFERILFQRGVLSYFDDIFVSSEYNARKSTGNLYRKVIDMLNTSPSNLLMIGDNLHSDYEMPRSLGLHAEIVTYVGKYRFYSNPRHELHQIFFDKTSPFSGWTPCLLEFIDRLYHNAKNNNCKKLLFCSREGQNIRKLFEIYQQEMYPSNTIETSYLYVSRRSTLLPSLDNLETEKFERIFHQYKELSINDFLYTVGFSKEEISELMQNNHINVNTRVSQNSNDFKTLLSINDFKNLYYVKRNKQNRLLVEYICQMNNGNLDEIHVVDIGWSGTIQDNIYSALKKKSKIYGYYFGLKNYRYSENNIKQGLMFNVGDKCDSYESKVYSYNHIELERVFAANHGQVLNYKMENNQIVPLLSVNSSDVDIYEYVNKWQKCMNNGFLSALQILNASKEDISSLSGYFLKEHLLYQTVIVPKQWKMYLTFRRKTKENYGNVSQNKIKNDTSTIRDKKQKKDYLYVDYSYRLLEKMHLQFLWPIAELYCRLVYFYKLTELNYEINKEKRNT